MTKRFENAMTALVTAFFDGTLGKEHCGACAVGNICAQAIGVKVSLTHDVVSRTPQAYWVYLFETQDGIQETRTRYGDESDIEAAVELIGKTGYSQEDLMKVEYVFETTSKISWESYGKYTKEEIMEDQFKGLCAVVDVLCEIEGLNSEDYKKCFEFDKELKQINQLVTA